jgi:hypothetical protein
MQLRAGFTGDENGTTKLLIDESGIKEFFFPDTVPDFMHFQMWRRRKKT